MSFIYTYWDATWSNTSIATVGITNNNNATTSAAINNNNKAGTEVSVTVVYSSGAPTQGIVVNVLRMVDDTPTFENPTDSPWGFVMPYSGGNTYHRSFTVAADRVDQFKIYVSNNSGVTVTVTVNYKQFTAEVIS